MAKTEMIDKVYPMTMGSMGTLRDAEPSWRIVFHRSGIVVALGWDNTTELHFIYAGSHHTRTVFKRYGRSYTQVAARHFADEIVEKYATVQS